MFPEFNLDVPEPLEPGDKNKELSPKAAAELEEWPKRRIKPEERERLERLLLKRLKENQTRLQQMLEQMSGRGHYEDHFYRYYHGSFKVYMPSGYAALLYLFDLR